MKRPAFQFYPGDWQRDAALRSCSVGARGLWIEMICIMHQAEPYGHLAINGSPIPPDTLARMVGATKREAAAWLLELERAAVFNRDGEMIVSRRMVRDEQIRKVRAEGGKLGGNPALKDKVKDTSKVNGKDNLPPNLQPTPSSSVLQSSGKSKEAAAPRDPLWGDGIETLKAANLSTESARAFVGKCLKDWPADVVTDALAEAKGTADPRAYTLKLLQAKPRKGQQDYTRGSV